MKSSLADSGDVSKHMPPLLAQGRHDGQQALDKVTAGTTLGPKASLAPPYDGTQGALCGITVFFGCMKRSNRIEYPRETVPP